jgi:RNA polymerase sigma factor FliA
MNELIESHLGYAHAIAADLAGRFPPNITRADLERAAEFGLVQAARSYDPSRCASFVTFAYYRVRGAIFDEVRKSWQASHLKGEADRAATEEIAGAMSQEATDSSSEDEYATSLQNNNYVISLDSNWPEQVSDAAESPVSQVLKQEESEAIKKAIRQLPKRHRFVLQAHYYEELSLASIGKRLNLSKSWVSRIHAQALVMVRRILQDSHRPSEVSQSNLSSRRQAVIPLHATFCSK